MRPSLRWALGLVLAMAAGAAAPSADPDSGGSSKNGTVAPGSGLPAVQERSYQMNARVRPLLFWIRKNDVGDARITWRAAEGAGRGYELLVGSDPLRAPRRINKWGFIREERSATGATVVGVMKQSKEESIKDAEEQLAREGKGGFVFQAIRTRVAGDRAEAGVVTYRSPVDLTYRDIGSLLTRVSGLEPPRLTTQVPANTWPGLLFAVADVLDETAKQAVRPGARMALPQPRRYVYYRTLYDLKVRSLDAVPDPQARDRALLDAEFEILNQRTRETTRFSLLYAPTGPGVGVPVKITFRPRWWFEVELVLRDPKAG